MNPVRSLEQRWQGEGRYRGVTAALMLNADGIVLGAGTRLVKRDGAGATLSDGKAARLLTLLAVAYGKPVDASVLKTIARAVEDARRGDEAKAAMRLALALPALSDPQTAARRLFVADGLLAKGVSPDDIWRALEFDDASRPSLLKYNPDEPRNPSGDGKASGEWTNGNNSSEAETPLAIAARRALGLAESSAEAAEGSAPLAARLSDLAAQLGGIAARVSGPAAFLSALLIPTPAGGRRQEGVVPGRPDLRYSWNEDETALRISRASDGKIVLGATLGPDGKFYNAKQRAIARLRNEHVLVDPAALPPEDPRSSQQRSEPQQCPSPSKDKIPTSGGGREYSDHMKPLINQPPTPPDKGYVLSNPFDHGQPVYYDDCQRETDVLIEYKGPNYASQMSNPYYGKAFTEYTREDWEAQATREIEASGGRPVRWYFAERGAQEFARKLFDASPILARIETIYEPLPGGEQ